MTLTKETIVKLANDLPEMVDVDELLERIVVLAKIEKGRQQARESKGISHEDMAKKVKSWSK